MTAALLMLAASVPALGGDDDGAWIFDRLAERGGESTLEFTETRKSELLTEPLEVSGTLHRDGDGNLVRTTRSPTRETQTLAEDHVEVRRDDGFRRRFRMDRAPELKALRSALIGILEADRNRLAEHFRIHAKRGEADRWCLRLAPDDAAVAERVEGITVHGRDSRLVRMHVRLADGETIRTELQPVQ